MMIIPLYLSTVKFEKVGLFFGKVHKKFANQHLTVMQKTSLTYLPRKFRFGQGFGDIS